MIFIWAEELSHGIGYHGHLPWNLPIEMDFFKKITTGNTLISGSRTFQSYGFYPLPRRKNIVLSLKNSDQFPSFVTVLSCVEEVLEYEWKHPDETLYVSGGAKVFASLMPYAQTLLKTMVGGHYEVDTYMPTVNYSVFDKVSSKVVLASKHIPVSLTFERYEHKKQ